MAFNYNHNYFMASLPNIQSNENLRIPQIEAYIKIKNYFESDYSNRSSLVVLPTGVGKTGLMGLVPYHMCKGRVLIITPWTAIKDSVIDSLNPDYHDNFWLKRGIFKTKSQLPNLIEYSGKETPYEVLSAANIVVLNIHKLQSRLNSSLVNIVDKDFFDMIIIDEAHHSTAKTWVECVDYFEKAKVIKLTGTPFRTDNKEINGHLVYKYPLSRAMYNNYVKSLENIEFIPQQLRLTIDEDDSKTYSIEEIYSMNLKDMDWVTRSVAYSLECSEKIVDNSIKLLKKKLNNGSKIPHKIIGIACSIKHAEQICELYENKGYKVALVHSKLNQNIKNKVMKDIENHRVQVVINVAMLGEGYDHPYLSVAAIFRPFRNELPYAQFIGRILRTISDEKAKPEDNIGQIVSHKHLELRKLWDKYKIEIQESEIIKKLRDYDELLDEDFDTGTRTNIEGSQNEILGNAKHYGESKLSVEAYLDTELIRKSREKDIEDKAKIEQLKSLFKGITDEQAMLMIEQMGNDSSAMKRPDLIYSTKKKDIDARIREEIVPRLIRIYKIDEEDDELKELSLFRGKYWYIKNKVKKNNAMLAMYMNAYLKDRIGKSRKDWLDNDFDIAFSVLDELEKYVEKNLKEFCSKKKEYSI
ncbi:DEAD/DEAH box helicase [Tepidibacter hydrothermalis]|uniref:DEAD/DEAH box helicase family protein n=1 Tax=Tepidibacter hydrothermalis TaxID=3036126 RepID=A0ABY8EA05_9FIRM|nr:DEAD/DEAH box helicase family protein [Tepidibacter hydrothermalis]WFD09740.1 DEAD/DEAH box helicase family protein [Tepidibacter hydrothermalis]